MTPASSRPVTILIADDHPIVRSGLRSVLEKAPGVMIVYEAENGDSALQIIRKSKPDIAFIDIEMPVMDGFAVAMAVQHESLPVSLIFMTMHNDEQTFSKAMDIGIKGFVLKENAVADIVNAVQLVLDGKYYISPLLSEYLIRRSKSKTPARDEIIKQLTPAESNILKLIAAQKTTKTIAEELFISPKTVEKHRSNICAKLNLRGAYALLKFAMENRGLL